MTRAFSLDMPFLRFARNTLIATLAALLPLLLIFVLKTPGFAGALSEGGPALWRFLRQVVTNGVPVVFVVNYCTFFLYASAVASGAIIRRPGTVLAVDIGARLGLFVGLHALIYVLSADWFGSFGGSRRTALSVVAPTLARSAFFENISGVYLYATMISAIPLYTAVIGPWLARRRASTPQGVHRRAFILSLLLFGAVVLGLTGIASLVAEFQPGR